MNPPQTETPQSPPVPYLNHRQLFPVGDGESGLTSAVKEFHRRFGHPVLYTPNLPQAKAEARREAKYAADDVRTHSVNQKHISHQVGGERALRMSLLAEEYAEYLEAESDSNLVEIADALADMTVIIYGTALTYGIPLDRVFSEVHRANMSKLGADGRPVKRGDGKVMKGPNYTPPDVEGVLDDAS